MAGIKEVEVLYKKIVTMLGAEVTEEDMWRAWDCALTMVMKGQAKELYSTDSKHQDCDIAEKVAHICSVQPSPFDTDALVRIQSPGAQSSYMGGNNTGITVNHRIEEAALEQTCEGEDSDPKRNGDFQNDDWSSEKYQRSLGIRAGNSIKHDTYEESDITPDTPTKLNRKDLSPALKRYVRSSDSLRIVKNKSYRRGTKHGRSHTGAKPYSCPECEKCFSRKSCFVTHQKSHTKKKKF